jgi:DNA polymerase (family 10)
MNNQDVARVFDEVADLLDIEGESAFKVQAYRNAANSIRGLNEDISIIRQEGRLRQLSGIGRGIAEKIEELLDTGEIHYHKKLRQMIPLDLITLTKIPGLGAKRAKRLYQELNIKTVDDLLSAIQDHKLAALKGFGAHTEQNILTGIRQFKEAQEGILLDEAYETAERFIEVLRGLPFVTRADIAGSLRRMKETVENADLVAASTQPQKVMEHLAGLHFVDQTVALSESRSSFIAKNGPRVDLRVTVPEQYEAALRYVTGSKDHNIRLQSVAEKQGLRVNENGVFKIVKEERVDAGTEESIYANLGMQYIPAPIREDKGEIEMALAHELPRLLQHEDIKGDLHVHSSWSDGQNNIRELAQEALRLGYSYIAISDHAEKLKIAGGLGKEELHRQKEEIEHLNEELAGFTVLSGIELNIDVNGNLDYEDRFLEEFDIVIAPIHTGFTQSAETLTPRIIKAIQNPHVDIIAHPTGRILKKRSPYALNLEAVFEAAARHDTLLELNSFPDRLDLKDDHLREARKHGIKIAINTDAHALFHLTYMRYGVSTAQRGWLEAKDVANTYDLDQLMKILKKRLG